MVQIDMPICMGCNRFNEDELSRNVCEAFPDGIPLPILQSDWDHRLRFAGDGGLKFDPKDQAASDYAESLFGEADAVTV